jgi:hypothetical protein
MTLAMQQKILFWLVTTVVVLAILILIPLVVGLWVKVLA